MNKQDKMNKHFWAAYNERQKIQRRIDVVEQTANCTRDRQELLEANSELEVLYRDLYYQNNLVGYYLNRARKARLPLWKRIFTK